MRRRRTVAIGLGLGGVLWSATEYGVHRWGMHGRRGTNPWSAEHLDHHARPERTVAVALDRGLALKLASAPVVALPAAVLGAPVLGVATGAGFAAGYVGYTHVHHTIHHRSPRGAAGRRLRKRHLAHHFATPRRNFGVTHAWWDALIRSGSTPERVTVPRRLAPVWMVDEHGELRPEHRGDYVLGGRARRPVSDADVALALADGAPRLE